MNNAAVTLIHEVHETAPLVNNWRTIDQRDGWTIYGGDCQHWRFVVAINRDGVHADGTGTKGAIILHLTPEMALEVARIAASKCP